MLEGRRKDSALEASSPTLLAHTSPSPTMLTRGGGGGGHALGGIRSITSLSPASNTSPPRRSTSPRLFSPPSLHARSVSPGEAWEREVGGGGHGLEGGQGGEIETFGRLERERLQGMMERERDARLARTSISRLERESKMVQESQKEQLRLRVSEREWETRGEEQDQREAERGISSIEYWAKERERKASASEQSSRDKVILYITKNW
jgi:hypothetical protein